MADGEIIEKIASIDEQIHDLRKMVVESGSRIKDDEAKSAAKAWLAEAKKLEKKWPKTAPSVLEMTKKKQGWYRNLSPKRVPLALELRAPFISTKAKPLFGIVFTPASVSLFPSPSY